MRSSSFWALGLILLLSTSCKKEPAVPEPIEDPLRALGAAHGLAIGSLFNYGYSHAGYADHAAYNSVISTHFDHMALEWEFSMDECWLGPQEYDFTYLDKALDFAEDHAMTVRGTHLFWYAQVPNWLENSSFNPMQIRDMAKAYVDTLFRHIHQQYPGVLTEVSVANEVLTDAETPGVSGWLREEFWSEKLGPYYIDSAFVWTRNAYPSGVLMLNDYGNEFAGTTKSVAFEELLSRLISAGIPVDAVGLQCHFTIDTTGQLDEPFDSTAFQLAIETYSTYGVDVYVTELDVRINDDQSGPSASKWERQAALYGQVTAMLRDAPSAKGMTLWGFNDDLSYLNGGAGWLPQNRDWGLIFDADYQTKPAFWTISGELEP